MPKDMLRKSAIRRHVLELIKEEHVFELRLMRVKQVGLYISGQPKPFKTFNCT